MSLLEFFDLFAEQSGWNSSAFSSIIFRYAFIAADILERDASESRWNEVKKHLNQNIRFCEIRNSGVKEIEILVDVGDICDEGVDED